MTFCLALTINIFSQAKEITGDESVQELIKAYAKFSETSWRKKQKTEFYKSGKLSNITEVIEESVKPDKRRIVKIEKTGRIIKKFEIIAIGETYYCRTNSGVWKKSDDWCDETKYFTKGMEERGNSKYTVEETKINDQNAKLYRQYITYNEDEKGLNYWDYKFWVSGEGFILQREIVTGLVKTKEIFSRMTEISQYNPRDLKIEAPMIKTKTK